MTEITQYISELNRIYRAGNATEHSYQPAQKWLKDRKGQTLGYDDIVHYQRIIRVLKETVEIMNEIEV
jgi:hypothetical protein